MPAGQRAIRYSDRSPRSALWICSLTVAINPHLLTRLSFRRLLTLTFRIAHLGTRSVGRRPELLAVAEVLGVNRSWSSVL